MKKATTSIVLDTRTQRKDGSYAVKLRITYNRQQKYYPLNIHLTEEEWDRVHTDRPRGEYKDHKLTFSEIEKRARKIIDILTPFTFQAFEKKFNQSAGDQKDALSAMSRYIDSLKNEERFSTAENYDCALTSITKYVHLSNRKKLLFEEISPEWLLRYEQWMVEKGRSLTTIGMYLRFLRAVIKIAIEQGELNEQLYPFGKRKYQIPQGQNVKKALLREDVQKIAEYQPENDAEARARDLWLFSYLCNGANVKDIALLKYSNVSESSIVFVRAKTARATKKNLKPIISMVLPEIISIIDKWGQKPVLPDTYVFGIMNDSIPKTRHKAVIRQATKTINKYIDRIAKELGISAKVRTYNARHTFATVMLQSKAPIELISEELGHSNIRTTAAYLGSFESQVKLEFKKQLLGYKLNSST